MQTPNHAWPRRGLLTPLWVACGLFGISTGSAVIIAWFEHWTTILQISPAFPPMQFNTALLFVFCGASLTALAGRYRAISPWMGGLAATVGGLTLIEYLSGADFGLDQLFIKAYITTSSFSPGRMSPLTAGCFVCLGIALGLTGPGRSQARLAARGLLACVTAMITILAIFGYLFGVETAYGWGSYTRMAVHTAATFLALSAGLLIWSWEEARRQNFFFTRWLPVTASVTLMTMIAITSSVSFTRLNSSQSWQNHTYDVLDVAQTLLDSLTDAQRGMRGFILSGEPGALDLYNRAIHNIPQQLEQLRQLTTDNPTQQQRLEMLKAACDEVIAYSHRLLAVREKQGLQGTVTMESTGEGLGVMNNARAELQAFTDEEDRLLKERESAVDSDFNNTRQVVIFGSGLAIVLLLVANLMASREVEFRRRAEAKFEEAASRQKAMLNSANHAIVSTNLEGVVTNFNQTAERWLGYAADEVVGKTTPVFWHDRDEVAARAAALTQELGRRVEPGFATFTAKVGPGKSVESEWTLIRKDGSRFPTLLSASVLTDSGGNTIGFLGVLTDLSERKKIEKELDRNRSLLNGILQNSLDGVLAFEAVRGLGGGIEDFRFVLVNPSAEKLSQMSAEKLVGRRLLEMFPNVSDDGLFRSYVTIVETGRTMEFEYCSNRSNPPRWYRVAGAKLGDGVSVSYMEITERKKADERLRVSEERFRLIVDGVKDYALLMLDPKGFVASWNTGAERLKGYKAEEIIGRHFSCFYSPEAIRNGHPEAELRIATNEGRYEEEGWRVSKDGGRFLANVVITAVRDGDGTLLGFAMVTRDVTEAKKFDKAVRDQAQILDLANDSIFVRDFSDRLTYWNQGAERVYGWRKDEVLGRVTHTLLKTKFPQPLFSIMDELISRGHWEGELEHVRKDGSHLIALSRWTLQPDETGKPARIIEMNHDITERKEMERALHEKNIELTSAAQAKNIFLANMSHELRTPLNGIIGFSEILADGLPGPVNEEQREYLGDILNSGQHLLQLINDVLDLAKVEAGRMELHPDAFPIATAIQQVCSVAYPMMQKKKIKLEVKVSPEVTEVTLDQQRLKQILYNLLSNAIKFTDDGGRVEINVAKLKGGKFALAVRDTGIGIKPENMKRLFKEFEQIDEGTTRRYQGTGLGLALTRKIVEMQDGRIEVASEFGQGTVFTVTLPIVAEAVTL